jgi:hypothetical protein
VDEFKDLSSLKTPADFRSMFPQVFQSDASLKWFMRRHREKIDAAEAVVIVNRRPLLDVPKFSNVVLQVGHRTVSETA